MKNKNNNQGFAHLIVALLLVVVGVISLTAYKVYKNTIYERNDYVNKSTDSDSEKALKYYNEVEKVEETTNNNSENNRESSDKNIVGNSNPEVKPYIPPNVVEPTSSIESLNTFYTAIKDKDYTTANNLVSKNLALQIAGLTNTSDVDSALQSCASSYLCNLVLTSTKPPSSGYTVKKITPTVGQSAEQVSFLLSQSSPSVASVTGDENIDIFMENYSGVWVIQNIYISGDSLKNYLSNY